MNKAAFLDRDGTINVDYGYVHEYKRFHFIKGAVDTLKALQERGYLLLILTNQSGIARGYYGTEEVEKLHKKVHGYLKEQGIQISKTYYCPHLSGCTCRKPLLGMFYQAVKEYDIDLRHSIAVGDNLRDLAICKAEPVEGFWITQSTEIVSKRIHKIHDIREVIPLLDDINKQHS